MKHQHFIVLGIMLSALGISANHGLADGAVFVGMCAITYGVIWGTLNYLNNGLK